VGSTLDVLLGTVDLLAIDPEAIGAEILARGEPVRLLVDVAPDGLITVEALGSCRTEAELRIEDDPELGLSVTGTIVTESPDGTVVEGTLERVYARPVADLPDVGAGAVFTSGNVDLGVRAGGEVVATGTAALFGRNALVLLTIGGTSAQGELALGR